MIIRLHRIRTAEPDICSLGKQGLWGERMKNRFKAGILAAFIILGIISSMSAVPVSASALPAQEAGIFTAVSGAARNGIVPVKGKKYYFVKDRMKTGKVSIGKKWYYFGPEMKFGLIRDAENRSRYYYADSSGVLQTGWKTAGGELHYFWPAAGEGHVRFQMAAGTVVIGGVTHYLDSGGVPRRTYNGKKLNRYGAVTGSSSVSSGKSGSSLDKKFYGDVSAGKTLTQKAILSCLNYYEAQLQKLNAANRFEETFHKKGQYPKNVWQYSNKFSSPLNHFFASFDRMNSGAFSRKGRTVRYCNCDSSKWWLVQDVLHTGGTTSEGLNLLWKKYTVKGTVFKDIYKKGYFTVKENGRQVRVRLVPGTCFYNSGMTHTWIYMGPSAKGVERFFDTGHGGVHSDPGKTDKVLAWERDPSGRYHTDKRRAVFRTWVNEITDTRCYEDKTIRTIWVPRDLKTVYYRNTGGKLVRF